MGNGNLVQGRRRQVAVRLLTPHGEREPVIALATSIPSTTLLTPHGERELGQLYCLATERPDS